MTGERIAPARMGEDQMVAERELLGAATEPAG